MNITKYAADLSKSQFDSIKRFLATDESHDKISEVKEEIKLLLYNKRNIPLETMNKNNI